MPHLGLQVAVETREGLVEQHRHRLAGKGAGRSRPAAAPRPTGSAARVGEMAEPNCSTGRPPIAAHRAGKWLRPKATFWRRSDAGTRRSPGRPGRFRAARAARKCPAGEQSPAASISPSPASRGLRSGATGALAAARRAQEAGIRSGHSSRLASRDDRASPIGLRYGADFEDWGLDHGGDPRCPGASRQSCG